MQIRFLSEVQKNNNMKNFEISANFIGLLFAEVEANTTEEAKEVFLNSIGASPNEHGDWSVTIENVSLPDSQFFLNELNMAFVEKITDEDKKHWEGIEIEETEN